MVNEPYYKKLARLNREAALRKVESDKCKHEHLHFENGGLHLVCDDCKYVYVAVGQCPARTMQDIMARGKGFTELDRRSNPYAVKKVAKAIKKSKSI